MFFPCNVVCTGNSKMKLYKSTHVTICYRKEVCSMMHHSPRYNRVDQKSFLLLFEAYVLQGLTKSPSESTYWYKIRCEKSIISTLYHLFSQATRNKEGGRGRRKPSPYSTCFKMYLFEPIAALSLVNSS